MDGKEVLNLLNRQLEMEQVREGFEGNMRKAFAYVCPRRYDIARSIRKGSQRLTKMYDGVAQDAFFSWVDGMLGWGVNEGLEWHKAVIPDLRYRDIDSIQRWLQKYTEQMDWEIRAGNFYENMPEQLQDGGSGGTAVMMTQESRDLSKCIHRVPHPGAYWIAENDEYEVDVYHEMETMTARKAMQKYNKPGDTLHPLVQKWAADPKSSLWECDFLTCICPADDAAMFDTNYTLGNKPWAIVTILYGMTAGSSQASSEALLTNSDSRLRLVRLEGIDYFPATVWRFRRNSDELYGFSPAMDVMSMIEAVQQHAFNLMDMGNRAARPMIAVPDEKRDSFKYLPGERVGYASEKRLPQVIPTAGEYPVAIDRENKMHDMIRKRYGWGVWNVMEIYQQKRERNQVGEIREARADQARLLAGQFNNFWRGGVRHTYDNIARIAARAGRMPAAPNELQELRGKDIVVPVFVGPLSQLQLEATKLGGMRQGLGLLTELAETLGRHLGPEEAYKVYARVNVPDLTEYICDNTGFPQELMNDDATTKALVQARADRVAAQEEAKMAQQLAAASGQLGKQPGPDSLLARGAA